MTTAAENRLFWKVDSDPHVPLFGMLGRLKRHLNERDRRWQRFVSAFLNGRPVHGFAPGDLEEGDAEVMRRVTARGEERRLVLNPSENCIAALAARVASQRPRATYLTETEGPDAWSLKQRARRLEKFVAGEWARGRFYRKTAKIFLHAGAVGFGAMHIYAGADAICFDVVPPWELIVDEQAAMNGETRTLMRRKWVPLETAIARFAGTGLPSKMRSANQAALEKAQADGGTIRRGVKTVTNMIPLLEAWHLPSGWGAEDGRHVICTQGRTLTPKEDWKWEQSRFPIAFFPWSQPIIGFWPQGLMEREEPAQVQLNKLLGRMQDAVHMYSVANTFFEDGSITKEHLKNATGNLIPVKKGTRLMPVTTMPNALSAELVKMVYDLRAWIHEETGVSQLSAASVKPAGIESGRGLMVLKDSETGRHALLNTQWDDSHVDSAELTEMAADELDERTDGGYSSTFVGRRAIERIPWKEVRIDREKRQIQVFPSSSLPHEPAGRFEQVENYRQGGYINKAQAQALMRMPDIDQLQSLDAADYEIVEWQIERILVHGEERMPMRYQDNELAREVGTAACLRAEMQGAPKDRIDKLKGYIEQADAYAQEAQAAAMPPAGAGPMQGMMPQGMMPQGSGLPPQ